MCLEAGFPIPQLSARPLRPWQNSALLSPLGEGCWAGTPEGPVSSELAKFRTASLFTTWVIGVSQLNFLASLCSFFSSPFFFHQEAPFGNAASGSPRERENDSCLYNSGSSRCGSAWEGVGAEKGVSVIPGKEETLRRWLGAGASGLGAPPSCPGETQTGY